MKQKMEKKQKNRPLRKIDSYYYPFWIMALLLLAFIVLYIQKDKIYSDSQQICIPKIPNTYISMDGSNLAVFVLDASDKYENSLINEIIKARLTIKQIKAGIE